MRIRIYGWEITQPFGASRPAVIQEDLLQALRDMRDVLLKESDWTQLPDCTLSEEVKNDWRIWRQSMRDITQTVDYPLAYTILLPEPPVTGRPKSWLNWDVDYQSQLPGYEQNEANIIHSIEHYIESNGIQ